MFSCGLICTVHGGNSATLTLLWNCVFKQVANTRPRWQDLHFQELPCFCVIILGYNKKSNDINLETEVPLKSLNPVPLFLNDYSFTRVKKFFFKRMNCIRKIKKSYYTVALLTLWNISFCFFLLSSCGHNSFEISFSSHLSLDNFPKFSKITP